MSFSLSNENFLKSIDNHMQQFGVDASKQAELKENANSIFTKYDEQKADGKAGKDGFWNSTESQNASGAMSDFMIKIAEMANNVAEIVGKKPAAAPSNPNTISNTTLDAANIYSAIKTSSSLNNVEQAIIDKVKSMPPQEQADFIWSNLDSFIQDGGKITSFDGDNITIVDKNGVEHKESLKGMGMSDEGIEALKPQIQIEQQGNEIDEISNDMELINNPENAKTIAHAGKAGYDNTNILNLLKSGLNISVVNGKYQISDAQGNSKGTISLLQNGQFSFDKEARFTNIEAVINKYESQGYEVSNPTPNKENHTIEIKIEKNGKTETITIDPKTGFEVSKEK